MTTAPTAEPPLLVRARQRLDDLNSAIGAGIYTQHTARKAARELSELIDYTVAHGMPVLRGPNPGLSMLAYWLGDWDAFIDQTTGRGVS